MDQDEIASLRNWDVGSLAKSLLGFDLWYFTFAWNVFSNLVTAYFAFRFFAAVVGLCMIYKNVQKTSLTDKIKDTIKNSNEHYKTIQVMKIKEKSKKDEIDKRMSNIEEGRKDDDKNGND